MKIRPEILTHPNIPKPLHGLNPRVLLGDSWWNKVRQEAYARNDYHCWACGIHKSSAVYHKWLEAHETYDINYEKGTAKMVEIVALCHCCHNFIHSGRLGSLLDKGEIAEGKVRFILESGFNILKKANLKPFWGTAYLYLTMQGYHNEDAEDILHGKELMPLHTIDARWEDWKLILNGQEFKTKFATFGEWQAYYND